MKWTRRWALGVAATVLVVAGTAAPAHASTNIGWMYTQGANGKAYFDADVAGWTGAEQITVCDIDTDGHSVRAYLYNENTGRLIEWIGDSQNDGSCVSVAYNMVTDEVLVELAVCDYEASTGKVWDCASARGWS
ncbi:hypothetical protein HDA40_002498 [Hamadaea flava]|uniref:Secreted protein n=1 Tax=Hamadaea flava TaxID=1742688 RepID=A0ABV8LKN0_9ACTN|nr:hypothetical protein [Hamadaea flava]MCP2323991.1 hypothetical protein [Hamadaea flava]